MDWTPTGSSLQRLEAAATSSPSSGLQYTSRLLFNRPSTKHPLPTHTANGFPTAPSPFHGTLPPAPLAPAHRLRNPPAAANAFRAASAEKQAAFQAQFRGPPLFRGEQDRDGSSDTNDSSITGNGFVLAPPKFVRREDLVETGLEGLFDTVFSLGDGGGGRENSATTSSRTMASAPTRDDSYETSGMLPAQLGGLERRAPLDRQLQQGRGQNGVTVMLVVAVVLAGGTFFATKGFGEWGWGESVAEWAYGGQAV